MLGFACLNAATLKVSIIAQEESATLEDIQGAGTDDDGTYALTDFALKNSKCFL